MPGRGCLLGMGGMCERGLVRGPTSSCIKQVSASSHLPGEAGTLACHPLSPSLLTYSWSWTPSSCLPLSLKAEAGRGWLQGPPQWDLERRQGQATFLEQKAPLHYNCRPSYHMPSADRSLLWEPGCADLPADPQNIYDFL